MGHSIRATLSYNEGHIYIQYIYIYIYPLFTLSEWSEKNQEGEALSLAGQLPYFPYGLYGTCSIMAS